jgi:hypothetical protein
LKIRQLSAPWLCLLLVGCGHTAGNIQQGGNRCEPDSQVTCGLDSPSAHINALIVEGHYEAAARTLAHYLAIGLVTAEAARKLQEELSKERQAKEDPKRLPPPIGDGTSGQERTCKSDYPDTLMCRSLPEEYIYNGNRQALEEMKAWFGQKDLSLHDPSPTLTGPCHGDGTHFNVRLRGQRKGSIVCCPCCVESPAGPIKINKCRIVW